MSATMTTDLSGAADHRAATLGFPNGLSDEVSVVRNADGTVTISILMGLQTEADGEAYPTEGMGELTLPAAAWAHLQGLGA